MVPKIEVLAGGLGEVTRKTQQEVGEGRAGLGTKKAEGSVERRVGILVDLVQMKLAAELQSMTPDHLRNRIAEIQRVVPLKCVGDRNAHHERWKHKIFDPFVLRRLHHDPGRARTSYKALRRKARAGAAMRLADVVHIP